jgi:hypothetical protein
MNWWYIEPSNTVPIWYEGSKTDEIGVSLLSRKIRMKGKNNEEHN